MKVIDAHTHPLFTSTSFGRVAKQNGATFTIKGFLREMKDSGVEKALLIGGLRADGSTRQGPFRLASNNDLLWTLEQNKKLFKGIAVISMDEKPENEADLVEEMLKKGTLAGLKFALGYENYYPTDERCERFYKLAEKYKVVSMFHTGDTSAEIGPRKVKYAHPLPLDDVAVRHLGMKIVLAHAGQHWMRDAAEVIGKNKNVYADLSGWFIGKSLPDHTDALKRMFEELIFWSNGCDKLMFGTDWPLMRIKPYIEFFDSCTFLSETEKKKIFWSNANKLYWGSE